MHTVDANGADIPALGFGTFQMSGEDTTRMVEHALRCGYRHIDTAQGYGNEQQVGLGLAQSGVDREEVFVTTKVAPDRFAPDDLGASVQESLRKLDLDSVDLVLLHWPNPDVPLRDTLRALLDARQRGWTRHVGVSNFPTALLAEAVGIAAELDGTALVTDQVEYHPYLSQRSVLEAVRGHGMALTAYSPLAQGAVLDDPVLQEVAEAHSATVGQVALAWLLAQDGVVAIPKTVSEERAEENLVAADITLSVDEVERVSGLAKPDGRVIDPPFAPEWDTA